VNGNAHGHDLLRSHMHARSVPLLPSDYECRLTSFSRPSYSLHHESGETMTRTPITCLRSTPVADLILQEEGLSFDLYRKFVYRIGGQTSLAHASGWSSRLSRINMSRYSRATKLGYIADTINNGNISSFSKWTLSAYSQNLTRHFWIAKCPWFSFF